MSLDIKNVKRIYYRGYLKSCNYTCSYCPFRKNSYDDLELDRKYVQKFVDFILKVDFKSQVSILFTPYGEAMNNEYYYNAICDLSKSSNIKNISIQTNLSFDDYKFIQYIEDNNGNFNKISLWASFHNEMVSALDFSNKVTRLSEKLNISVGSVGSKQSKTDIEKLRILLPKYIYLWVNKVEGIYSGDIDFSYIDPLYSIEQKFLKCNYNLCNCNHESIFIKENGKVFYCNKSRKSIGNIYSDKDFINIKTQSHKCDCYLSYSNRLDINQLCLLDVQSRLFNLKKPKAIFFDIDGTLINNEINYFDVVKHISEKYNIDIYFATGRSYKSACLICKDILKYVKGGVFDYGAYVKTDNYLYKTYINNHSNRMKVISKNKLIKNNDIRVIYEGDKYIGVNKNVNKYTGVKKICDNYGYTSEDVWIFGNSYEDVCMFKNFKYSFSTFNSDEYALKNSILTINLDMIYMFLRNFN